MDIYTKMMENMDFKLEIKDLSVDDIVKIIKEKEDKEDNNEIYIKYKNDDCKNVKIFGHSFVQNNKDKCYIIFEGINYKLQEYFNFKDYKKK